MIFIIRKDFIKKRSSLFFVKRSFKNVRKKRFESYQDLFENIFIPSAWFFRRFLEDFNVRFRKIFSLGFFWWTFGTILTLNVDHYRLSFIPSIFWLKFYWDLFSFRSILRLKMKLLLKIVVVFKSKIISYKYIL